jgi:hypothetical protein
MSYRSLAFVIAALSSMPIASADAQSVYVAPGGVYVANGPVYVTPAPNLPPPAPYVAPSAGYYGPPAVVAPAPVVAPTVVYGPNGGGYYGPNGGGYYGPNGGGYYDAPVSAYAAELPPRPPVAVPYYGGNRYSYGPRY